MFLYRKANADHYHAREAKSPAAEANAVGTGGCSSPRIRKQLRVSFNKATTPAASGRVYTHTNSSTISSRVGMMAQGPHEPKNTGLSHCRPRMSPRAKSLRPFACIVSM